MRNDSLFAVKKENPIVALFRILAIATLAYFSAVFFDLLLVRVSELPHGALWDPSFKAPLFFIMMVVVCGIIAIPYFMKDWDPTLRTWSMYTAALIVAYAVFDGSGFIDPGYPLKWLVAHVATPAMQKLSH